jgi:hypothetical protein
VRRRLALTITAVSALCAVILGRPLPSLALTSTSYTTNVITAARITSGQTWESTSGCQVGVGSGYEYRCAFEFDISIPSTAKITSAMLKLKKIAGPGCFASDCPVDISAYAGNGTANLPADLSAGTLARIFSPDGSFQALDVAADLQARVSNGLDWIGYRLSRDSSSTHNPDVQEFDVSGTTRATLAVSYVAQPVDVTVHLGGSATGVVTSNIGGISCGEFCTATFEYAEPVTLTAQPAAFTIFQGWQGGECDGISDPVCQFIVPALDMTTTANFLYLGPPASAPPNPTPTMFQITPPPLTPPPLTAPPSGAPRPTGPAPTGGPAPTVAPVPTDVIASDGTIITPPPPTLPPGVTPAPTILGLGADAGQAGASGGIPLPLVILLILVLGGAVGGGVYWYTKRQRAAAP